MPFWVNPIIIRSTPYFRKPPIIRSVFICTSYFEAGERIKEVFSKIDGRRKKSPHKEKGINEVKIGMELGEMMEIRGRREGKLKGD